MMKGSVQVVGLVAEGGQVKGWFTPNGIGLRDRNAGFSSNRGEFAVLGLGFTISPKAERACPLTRNQLKVLISRIPDRGMFI